MMLEQNDCLILYIFFFYRADMDGKLVLSTTIMNMMEKKLCVAIRRQNDWTADWKITERGRKTWIKDINNREREEQL